MKHNEHERPSPADEILVEIEEELLLRQLGNLASKLRGSCSLHAAQAATCMYQNFDRSTSSSSTKSLYLFCHVAFITLITTIARGSPRTTLAYLHSLPRMVSVNLAEARRATYLEHVDHILSVQSSCRPDCEETGGGGRHACCYRSLGLT